jgi:methylated-DNA-[protein]-cysteine S-methyltransferase
MYSFIYNSPLGALHINANEQHICSVRFGSKNSHSFNQNSTDAPSPLQQTCQKQLDAYFNGTNLQFDLPLQQSGTEFQQKVWAGLCNIKPGNTISYLSFSKQLGNAKAIRAVGTANGSNNIAIIVPCHRVIGSNGQLVGYAGELWRKQWLLQHEAKYCNGVQDLFYTDSSLQ